MGRCQLHPAACAVQGKAEAAKQYNRHDLGCSSQNSHKDMFLQQADATGKPVPCFATMNQLAYGEPCTCQASRPSMTTIIKLPPAPLAQIASRLPCTA